MVGGSTVDVGMFIRKVGSVKSHQLTWQAEISPPVHWGKQTSSFFPLFSHFPAKHVSLQKKKTFNKTEDLYNKWKFGLCSTFVEDLLQVR